MTHHDVLKDKDYNLVSTLYHALQGAETAETYMKDAQGQGDQELQGYFEEVQKQYTELANRAKGLLSKRIG